MSGIERHSGSTRKTWEGKHRFEHWRRDNQVYFITSRVRHRQPAFVTEQAKQVFWDSFTEKTERFGFVPSVTSLLGNHYHTQGYSRGVAGAGAWGVPGRGAVPAV